LQQKSEQAQGVAVSLAFQQTGKFPLVFLHRLRQQDHMALPVAGIHAAASPFRRHAAMICRHDFIIRFLIHDLGLEYVI